MTAQMLEQMYTNAMSTDNYPMMELLEGLKANAAEQNSGGENSHEQRNRPQISQPQGI